MLHVPEKPFEVKLFRHKFNSQEKSKYLLIKKLHRNGQISIQSFSYKLFEKHGSVDNRTKSFCCLHYTKTKSIAAVQNAFLERFPDRNPPCKTTILRNFQKYSNAGTSLNLNKGNSGRRRTTRTEENIAAIRALLEENPRVSARRNPIDISSSSFNRITKFELRWHPYKMHVRHQLLPTDLPRRLHFAEWFVERCRRRPNFLESLIVGDEAALAMNGEVCTHNVRQLRKKDIRRNLISKGMLPVRNSISGQQSAATVSFWGLTFSIVMLPVLSTSGC